MTLIFILLVSYKYNIIHVLLYIFYDLICALFPKFVFHYLCISIFLHKYKIKICILLFVNFPTFFSLNIIILI